MKQIEALQNIITRYKPQLEENNYKAIMDDKNMNCEQLSILLLALCEAEVEPFTVLKAVDDVSWFVRQLWELHRRWMNAVFVGSPDQDEADIIGVAMVAYALGATVWYVPEVRNYLVSWKTLSAVAASAEFEDYDPTQFKEMRWTDADLYE